jgi:D-serine deaminase-like pyridoxal phosphate-dependent protein
MSLTNEVVKGLSPRVASDLPPEERVRGSSIFTGPFTWPLLTVDAAAVSHNISTLADFCRRHGLELSPHGKTTMAPNVFHMQVAAGAWGITVANVQQAAVVRGAGINRVLIANEVVDERALEWVFAEQLADPDCEILFNVDSLDGARRVAAAAASADRGRPYPVFIEVGYDGGRAGCRSVEETLAVAAELQRSGSLAVEGIAAYEGSLQLPDVVAFFDLLKKHLQALHDAGAFLVGRPVTLTVGGSKFFDLVALHWGNSWEAPYEKRVILRSGAYVTHDDLYYDRLNPFGRIPEEGSLQSALTLWAEVLSTPEPGLAICGFGLRDASSDLGYPVPLRLRRDGVARSAGPHVVRKLNDQHAFLDVDPRQPLAVGDVIGFGVSHPCTSIDRWRQLVAVDPEQRVLALWPTYF